ncbi:MAG: Hsp70 family protein [Proteobacteria bacterium]|nr:Hsp70 family protein [Pseudomonadota bacterium]
MTGIGLDFGTTNSALARLAGRGRAELAQHETASGRTTSVFRWILFFDPNGQEPGQPAPHTCGPDAIAHYLDCDGEGRLMQSMKSHLASRGLTSTGVYGKKYTLEELIGGIVRDLRRSAERTMGTLSGPVVAGRPVRLVGARSAEDDAFAEGRLREALALGGFEDIRFELEPVAAAWHYEASLDHDEVVLIGDFGGGTSDFCLLEVGPSHRGTGGSERVLGTAGVGLAGDAFDRQILHRLVSPELDRGSDYRSLFGQELPIPSWVFRYLERWHRLSELASPKNLRMLREYERTALHPGRIEALIHLVESNLGYALYRRVEAAKVDLSAEEQTTMAFSHGPIELASPMARADFEAWIASAIGQVQTCVDGLLSDCGADIGDVDRVFLTGGSAQVPAVRRLFEDRFGADRVRSGDHLTSVASGLALLAG